MFYIFLMFLTMERWQETRERKIQQRSAVGLNIVGHGQHLNPYITGTAHELFQTHKSVRNKKQLLKWLLSRIVGFVWWWQIFISDPDKWGKDLWGLQGFLIHPSLQNNLKPNLTWHEMIDDEMMHFVNEGWQLSQTIMATFQSKAQETSDNNYA